MDKNDKIFITKILPKIVDILDEKKPRFLIDGFYPYLLTSLFKGYDMQKISTLVRYKQEYVEQFIKDILGLLSDHYKIRINQEKFRDIMLSIFPDLFL